MVKAGDFCLIFSVLIIGIIPCLGNMAYRQYAISGKAKSEQTVKTKNPQR